MKITLVIILASYLQVSASGYSQNRTGPSYQLIANNLIINKVGSNILQEVYVSGKVVSATGEPITGVSVTVRGSSIGTTTNAGGSYQLTVPDGATLIFSFVGYITQEAVVSPTNTVINITLQPSTKAMDEVVVVGYGTQRRQEGNWFCCFSKGF